MNISCVVIDDEILARDVLKEFISKTPILELMGDFDSPIKATGKIVNENIQLIFLDINMPDLNGVKFYESLPVKPKVIFTTAYSDYAIKGFDMNAVDFLLKPFSYDRFFQSICKLIQPSASHPLRIQEMYNTPTQDQGAYIFVKVEYETLKIRLDEISYFEGLKDYVRIHLIHTERPILTLNSIKHYEMSLFSKGFIRIHKSVVISISQIEKISRQKVKLYNKDPFLMIGENYKQFFYELVVNQHY